MIVYGDPQFVTTVPDFKARLLAPSKGLDAARACLIGCGQLQQAVEDCPEAPDDLLNGVCAATSLAAMSFLRRWRGVGEDDAKLARAIDHIPDSFGAPLTIKVPEGFAFYALYPEQYILAAQAWLEEHSADTNRRVHIVGIRSIGTSLAALAAAAILWTPGWQANWTTVRPEGDPFDRKVDIVGGQFEPGDWAIVVDEGPGLSGSSMAAVHAALTRRGVAPERIGLFPGHGGEAGPQSPDWARAVWNKAQRFVASQDVLRWDGLGLQETLRAATADLLGERRPDVLAIGDLGGGLWRRFVYGDDPVSWPAAYAPFERPKYRCGLPNGRRLLWKFAGLADAGDPCGNQTQATIARLERLASRGWTADPIGSALGFVATEWIDGAPLSASEIGRPELAGLLGRYIADASLPPVSSAERAAGFERLRELLYWNVWEAFGEEMAKATVLLADEAQSDAEPNIPAYGDGRMAACEWVRRESDGRILKIDAGGHESDHTAVGRQPVWWDAAGAAVEWGMDAAQTEAMQRALCSELSIASPSPRSFAFYCAAYAAFRLGMATLCAQTASDPAEIERLNSDTWRYRLILERFIDRDR